MVVLELIARGETKPFGKIGIDNSGKVFVEGLEEEYYLDWLSSPIGNDVGEDVEPTEGARFLEAVKFQLLRNALDSELSINGPIEA